MPFIEVKAGGPNTDIQPGVYAVTLTEIGDPRTVTAQRGPNAGQDVTLLDWTFALEDGVTIDASTSTASGPKSKMFAFLTALFGGKAPPIGTQLEKEHLIGRQALATIQIDDNGWPRIVNLGAIPNTLPLPQAQHQPVVPTDSSAMVRQPRGRKPVTEAPVYNAQGYQGTAQQVAAAAAASADDDLPF